MSLRSSPPRPAGQKGFTLVEMAGVLLAISVLVGVLVPNVGRFNALARDVRVREDLGAICSSLKVMLDDLGLSAYWGQGGYGYGRSSLTGYAATGGSTVVGGGVEVTQQQTDTIEWCVNCEMPAAECGTCRGDDCADSCRDDCGPGCGTPANTISVPVTTQTYHYLPGRRVSTGGAAVASYSSGSLYGYGGAYARPLGLMIGQGNVPGSTIGWTEWQLGPAATFTRSTIGYTPVAMNFWVGSLGNQLIHHNPTYYAYAGAYGAGYGYRAGYGYGAGAGYGSTGYEIMRFRWRGPYIADEIIPDPWGNRYMVNSFGLHAPSTGVGHGAYGGAAGAYGTYGGTGYGGGVSRYLPQFASATVCYSAGPNGTIDTPFAQPAGWTTGGDDLTVVLSGAGGIR